MKTNILTKNVLLLVSLIVIGLIPIMSCVQQEKSNLRIHGF